MSLDEIIQLINWIENHKIELKEQSTIKGELWLNAVEILNAYGAFKEALFVMKQGKEEYERKADA